MAELFSDAWMKGYQEAWNTEPDLSGALESIGFNSTIGYGFIDQKQATAFIKVENGKVVEAGSYDGQPLNWDLRASADSWGKWARDGIGMAGLGMAFTTGKLKFPIGDYKAMLKDPRMAGPFIKSFTAMGRV
jgi:hypothetical protein